MNRFIFSLFAFIMFLMVMIFIFISLGFSQVDLTQQAYNIFDKTVVSGSGDATVTETYRQIWSADTPQTMQQPPMVRDFFGERAPVHLSFLLSSGYLQLPIHRMVRPLLAAAALTAQWSRIDL